jgi:hypothetical protein
MKFYLVVELVKICIFCYGDVFIEYKKQKYRGHPEFMLLDVNN